MLNLFTPLPPLSVIVQIWSPPSPPLDIQHALKMYAILDLSLLLFH